MAETIVVTQTSNPIIEVSTPGPQGLVPYLDFVSGAYYRPQGSYNILGAVNNRTDYSVLFVPKTQTFNQIAVRTGSTFVGTINGVVRLGIYANAGGKPSSLVLDAGTVTTIAASTTYGITINQTLEAGFYWLAINSQVQASTPTYYGNAGNIAAYNSFQNLPYEPTLTTGSVITGYYQSGVTGAFPATATPVATGTGGVNNIIVPFLRAA